MDVAQGPGKRVAAGQKGGWQEPAGGPLDHQGEALVFAGGQRALSSECF